MKIPKELKGEVQKFENLRFGILILNCESGSVGRYEKLWTLTQRIRDFYTQPFKPEMIEEYFEGVLSDNTEYCLTDGTIVYTDEYSDWKQIDLCVHGNQPQFYVTNLKTLSDFIDACLNSEIKLKWRIK